MSQKPGPAQQLRAAIDRLPGFLKRAVLDGIAHRPILAGHDRDGDGAACPMLAAPVHWDSVDAANLRRAQDVAWAWDAYAGATRSWHRASDRHLLALRSMLEASLLESDELEYLFPEDTPRPVYHRESCPSHAIRSRSASGSPWRERVAPGSHCSPGRSRGRSRAAVTGS